MRDVAVYHVFVCALFTGAGRYAVHIPPCTGKQSTHKYMIQCHITHNNEIFIILIRDFSKEQYVLPEDDMRCAIETCRSSASALV